MDKVSSQVSEEEDKKPARKSKRILKIVGLVCAGLVGIAILFLVGFIFYAKLSPTYTDSEGNVWQKYEGDKSTPAFTVFAEQGGVDKDKKPVSKINISSGCDPKNLGSKDLEGDFTKGVERSNHCVISNAASVISSSTPSGSAVSPFADNSSLAYYLLLSDGSLISLDGTVANKIQVNINSDGTNIIQSEGTAYYHIQKQADGKKFTIGMGQETFTAVGTDLLFKTDGTTASLRNYQVAVVKGSVNVTYRKISTLGSRILERVGRKTAKKGDEFPVKEKQKVAYAYHRDIPPTITPIDMADTDTLITNKFAQKYSMIFVMIYSKGVSFDQVKLALQEVLATIQKANQLAVDASQIQNTSAATFDPSDCSAIPGHHKESDGTCCPDGQSLWPEMGDGCWLDSRIAASKKSSGSSSSGGSSSGSGSTGTSCPPANIPRPTSCQSNSMKDGKCWCNYEGNEGWWSPECLPSGVTCN